jgi:hypothetical protein
VGAFCEEFGPLEDVTLVLVPAAGVTAERVAAAVTAEVELGLRRSLDDVGDMLVHADPAPRSALERSADAVVGDEPDLRAAMRRLVRAGRAST